LFDRIPRGVVTVDPRQDRFWVRQREPAGTGFDPFGARALGSLPERRGVSHACIARICNEVFVWPLIWLSPN